MRVFHTIPSAGPSDLTRSSTRWLGITATVLATTAAVLLASFIAVAVGLT